MGKKLTKNSKLLVIVVFFAFLMIFFLLSWPQNLNSYEKKIEIKPGFSLKTISKILSEKGIVSNSKLFILATKLLGKEKEIPVGTFTLIDANTNFSIIKQLVNSSPETINIKLLEGWNVKQISNELSKRLGFDQNELLKLSKNYSFLSNHNINAVF